MIEVEVHQQLRAFWRDRGVLPWPHHLTVARLVARAWRTGQSAILQVGTAATTGQHRASYLAAALLLGRPVVIVAAPEVQQQILGVDLPPLQEWLAAAGQSPVAVRAVAQPTDLALVGPDREILLLSPAVWLADRLAGERSRLAGWPTLIEGADELEDHARDLLGVRVGWADWEALRLARPDQADRLRDVQAALVRAAFDHPANPYECFALEGTNRTAWAKLLAELAQTPGGLLLPIWQAFACALAQSDWPLLVEIDRLRGQVAWLCRPVDLALALAPLWSGQSVVAIGGWLDAEADAAIFRERLGWHEPATAVRFGDRDREALPLYLPDRFPMPNTPEFQPAFLRQLYALLALYCDSDPTGAGFTVVLVGDLPLKSQVAAHLAADFGSRVSVDRLPLAAEVGSLPQASNAILVCSWAFWRSHQNQLPVPRLLAIAALPIPSLEDPEVAGRVAYCKRHRRDWFRWYLLPTALSELQRAVAPLRGRLGSHHPNALIALLDSRAARRSYGPQILAAIGPVARSNYLDPHWLH